jgi:lipoprotein-releasing system permease protein
MKQHYSVFIALRYLMSRKKRASISFNTFMSTMGIALGVFALLLVLSVMSGYTETLQNKILGVNAHIVALSYSGRIANYDDVADKLMKIDGVKGVSPFLMGQVMISHDRKSRGIFIRGIETHRERQTTDIHKHIIEGDFDAIDIRSDLPGIIIGNEIANDLNAGVSDIVNIISPMGSRQIVGFTPRVQQFRVTAIFRSGMYEYDSTLGITSIRDLQNFFQTGKTANVIQLKLDDIYNTIPVKAAVKEILGPRFYTRDWMDMNRNLFAALKLQKFTFFIILTLIVVVAAFNIISSLVMNVLEKGREIAILKAMGSTNRGIMSVFMIQGFLVGFVGTVIGIVSAYIIGYLLNAYHFIKLPADIYYLGHLTASFKLSDFIAVTVSAMIICFLATLYPSWKASRLDPVEPLRYE